MSYFKNKKAVSLIIGSLLVLGVVGVLYAQDTVYLPIIEKQSDTTSQSTQTDTPGTDVYLPISPRDAGSEEISSSPTPVSGKKMEDWLVYEDEFVKGFRVKYPPDWYASGGIYSYDPSPESRDWKRFVPTKDTVKMLFYWEEDQSKVSALNTVQASSLTISSYPKERHSTVLDVQSTSIGNHSAITTVQRDDSPMSQGQRKYRLYHIVHKDKVFTVLVEPINSNHENTISKIISSIEFPD